VGLALLRVAWSPRLLGGVVALSGIIYLVQGWVAGVEGFSATQSIAIVAAWIVSLVWMIWLAVIVRRLPAA
jgi:hypothetical protein